MFVYSGNSKHSEDSEVKETIGVSSGRKYANSQFSNQNRQDAITARCRLCRIAREARSESTDGLAAGTHGHVNSTGCKGMATTVMTAHHSIWRHLHDSMYAAQKPQSKLKFVFLDKESNMNTLWRREDFLRICSKEDLAEKAQDIEVTIPVKKVRRHTTTLIQCLSLWAGHGWGRNQ